MYGIVSRFRRHFSSIKVVTQDFHLSLFYADLQYINVQSSQELIYLIFSFCNLFINSFFLGAEGYFCYLLPVNGIVSKELLTQYHVPSFFFLYFIQFSGINSLVLFLDDNKFPLGQWQKRFFLLV